MYMYIIMYIIILVILKTIYKQMISVIITGKSATSGNKLYYKKL